MSIARMMKSQYQRRILFWSSIAVLFIICVTVIFIYHFAPDERWVNIIIALLLSVLASTVFALSSALYLHYFFVDPFEVDSSRKLLPQDIGSALEGIADATGDYRIFVRTGRHFRAEVLPRLVKRSKRTRSPIRIEAVLLDFRDLDVCQRYVAYRGSATFDKAVWGLEYVQKEILATVLALIDSRKNSGNLISIDLYLSRRLSTFRMDGSTDQILITREGPQDLASRYFRSDPDFAAFSHEFEWIKQEADLFTLPEGECTASVVGEALGAGPLVSSLWDAADSAKAARSPYGP